MVFAERAVLQIFIIIFTINGLHSSHRHRHRQLGFLSQLISENSKSPLIVVVNTGKHVRTLDGDNFEREDGQDAAAEINSINGYDDDLIRNNYQSVLYDVLRSSKNTVDNEEERIAQEKLIEKALRSRCQAKIVCEEKCSAESEEKPKKFCQKSCKAVFDDLIKCPPPGNREKDRKKEKKKDQCGPATGKTCPPSWRKK